MLDFAEMGEGGNPLRAALGEVRAVQKRKDEYAGKDCELCLGMNAHANLSAGAEAIGPVLEEMSKYSVMRGIRESCAQADEYPELFGPGEMMPGGALGNLDAEDFRSGYALLAKYGWSFDAWCDRFRLIFDRFSADFRLNLVCF